jgi:hypothetical protein
MPSSRKITLPKKATGAAPGLVSPENWNRVVEALATLLAQTLENSPQSGADIGIRKSAGGWVPYLKRRGKSNQISKPLTIKKGTSDNKFQIVPGYVNYSIPTLAGTALDDPTAPEITVTADDVYIYAKVVGTFGDPDDYVVTIHSQSTPTHPTEAISGTAFTSYFPIGEINFTAGSPPRCQHANYHSGGNLGVESFGGVNLWWRK